MDPRLSKLPQFLLPALSRGHAGFYVGPEHDLYVMGGRLPCGCCSSIGHGATGYKISKDGTVLDAGTPMDQLSLNGLEQVFYYGPGEITDIFNTLKRGMDK